MLSVMATVYQNLGLNSRAEPLLEKAIVLRRWLGPEHPDTLRLQGQLGSVLAEEARTPKQRRWIASW